MSGYLLGLATIPAVGLLTIAVVLARWAVRANTGWTEGCDVCVKVWFHRPAFSAIRWWWHKRFTCPAAHGPSRRATVLAMPAEEQRRRRREWRAKSDAILDKAAGREWVPMADLIGKRGDAA